MGIPTFRLNLRPSSPIPLIISLRIKTPHMGIFVLPRGHDLAITMSMELRHGTSCFSAVVHPAACMEQNAHVLPDGTRANLGLAGSSFTFRAIVSRPEYFTHVSTPFFTASNAPQGSPSQKAPACARTTERTSSSGTPGEIVGVYSGSLREDLARSSSYHCKAAAPATSPYTATNLGTKSSTASRAGHSFYS